MIIGRGRSASDTQLSPYAFNSASLTVSRIISAPDLIQALSWSDSCDADALTYICLDGSGVPASPPDYSSLAPIPPRYPIHPREEEGRERLPEYSSSVYLEGYLMRKCELSSPFMPSAQRSWHKVHLQLNNTQLNVYSVCPASPQSTSSGTATMAGGAQPSSDSSHPPSIRSFTSRSSTVSSSSPPSPVHKDYCIARLSRSYTLQYAEVGVAVDYSKRPHVLRIRAESEQFLLEFEDQESCIKWANVLQSAIDLALPLEERCLPKFRSIPRRNRHRRHANTVDRIIDNSYYSNSSSNNATSNTASNPFSRIYSRFKRSTKARQSQPSQTSQTSLSDEVYEPVVSANTLSSGPAELVISSNSPAEPESDGDPEPDTCSVAEDFAENEGETTNSYYDEKWEPFHPTQSKKTFLKYAQRCLYPLPASTPWIDKQIVVDGRKVVVRRDNLEPCAQLLVV